MNNSIAREEVLSDGTSRWHIEPVLPPPEPLARDFLREPPEWLRPLIQPESSLRDLV